MINIEEVTKNIDKLDIIDPFSFKYITPSFKNMSTLKFNIKFYSYYSNRYEITYFFISISNYLKILNKIFNNNRNICFLCKKKYTNNLCCNLCHEWFCNLCSKLHFKEDPLHDENLKIFDMNNVGGRCKQILDMKFLTLDNIQKNWLICECEKGGGEVICSCRHGLRCKNCIYSKYTLCDYCDCDYVAIYFRFFNLDLVFLESELKNYKYHEEIEQIRSNIENFNNRIAKTFLENINRIEKKSRKKRFKKHFYNIRNNFIAYSQLKLIVGNIIKKNKNYNLIKLYKAQKYSKLIMNKFKYDKKLTENDNISKLSNFFATKKPIFLVEKKNKRRSFFNKTIFIKNRRKNK